MHGKTTIWFDFFPPEGLTFLFIEWNRFFLIGDLNEALHDQLVGI